MYSREKFKKAIELYLKYDKSVASVIRELGYPSRKMLPRWYMEQTPTNGWSRNISTMHIDTQTHVRHGKARSKLPKLISGELRVPDAERIAGRCL